jgi:hypothetical protein
MHLPKKITTGHYVLSYNPEKTQKTAQEAENSSTVDVYAQENIHELPAGSQEPF